MAQTAKGKREFVQLATEMSPRDRGVISIGNWWASEKLDGMRALWLPDTRGLMFGNIIFANLDANKRGPTGLAHRPVSGLWSRYGRPIWAPDSWIKEQLTNGVLKLDRALDGELFLGRKQHDEVMSIVKKSLEENIDEDKWSDVKYHVFDSPRFTEVYGDGRIHNNTFKKEFKGVYDWMVQNNPTHFDLYRMDRTRHETFEHLLVNNDLTVNKLPLLKQLNWRPSVAMEEASALFEEITAGGGEGLIVRHGGSVWTPLRVNSYLKLKPYLDDEGIVIGYVDGVGRLAGTVGSVTLQYHNVQFGLSGWTDEERHAIRDGKLCKIGEKVTFKYRETSKDGVPIEARYLRKREEE